MQSKLLSHHRSWDLKVRPLIHALSLPDFLLLTQVVSTPTLTGDSLQGPLSRGRCSPESMTCPLILQLISYLSVQLHKVRPFCSPNLAHEGLTAAFASPPGMPVPILSVCAEPLRVTLAFV